MRTKRAFIILVSMLIFSILIANVANILNHDTEYYPKENEKKTDIYMDASMNHLVWFLQISDIHISMFRDPARIIEFKEFCDYTVEAINPAVVLASGDLTDAKTSDNIGSKQFRQEWEYYRNVLNETKVLSKTTWLDIRGNHDNFNVVSQDSKENYFTNYSIQGKQHPRSYMKQITRNGDTYSFIGIDACLEPGPRRPFNFVGMIDETEIIHLNTLINQVKSSQSSHTVWFGHFPTSCILSSGNETVRMMLRKLDQSLVYVCGHLHTLGGIVPKMYTLQKDGFLELELGDWKDNRLFRLMAIDHGLLSFIDETHDNWPLVLITNPKHALFVIPQKDNLNVMINSTHIRILAFSLSEIDLVRVRINGNTWQACQHVQGPLYVSRWDPSLYMSGLHHIEAYVSDIDGRSKRVSQPFSMDGTRLSFDLLPRFALMTNASIVFKLMFGTMLLSTVFPLILLRVLHRMVKGGKLERPRMRRGCLKTIVSKFWILTTVDRIFWPLVLYPIYLTVGPWSIGHIIEDYIGVIFAWGIFVNGTFLPGSFTYAYGFLQLVTFQIPISIILANGVYHRFQQHVLKTGKKMTAMGYVCLQIPFVILLTVQIIMAYFFWLAYGTMAFVLGPLRTWSIFLALILWQQALRLPAHTLREAASVWCVAPQSSISRTDLSLNENSSRN